MKERLINHVSLTRRLRQLLVLFALLLLPAGMWAEDVTTTYTFTRTTASSESGCKYDVTSTDGSENQTWRVKNFIATDENQANMGTSAYVLSETSFGISNIYSSSERSTIIDFMLESDFTLAGHFVSAEITYSTNGMSQSKAIVYKVTNIYNTLTDPTEPYVVLGTSPATLSLGDGFEDNKSFEGNKIALSFTFTAAKTGSSTTSFTIQSIKITTTPITTYNIWVGGTQVTEVNQGDVLGDGTVSYDGTFLYLGNAEINGDIIYNGDFNAFYILLTGANTVNRITYIGQQEDVELFVMKANEEPGFRSLTVEGNGTDAAISGFSNMASIMTERYDSNEKLYWKPTVTNDVITSLLVTTDVSAEAYNLWISGTQVTTANAANVLGDDETPTVVYDAENHKLTLNGASVGQITYSGTSNLTIAFSGTCSITTEESNDAIRYVGSESTRPKLTFSLTNETGSLSINGESLVIKGFSDVDFGSLNLASTSAQGVYYDTDDFLMRGHDNNPSDLTITTETYYPIWIYDPSLSQTGYSHTQLSGESTIEIGEGTVSFDGEHTITISNIAFNYEGNTMIVVGPSMEQLTVNLVGESTATDCSVLSLWDTTPLTFTTSESTPGSLTGSDIVLWKNFGNGQISYQNGLNVFYDVENSYKKTISTTGTYFKIGNTEVSATGDITTSEGTAHFDASFNTLTLTGATIGSTDVSTDIQVLVDNLIIEISGTNTIYGNITYNGSNYQSSNIQINKASNVESASLKVTNVEGFTSCTWGDGLYLSAQDAQGATVDVHYEHYEGEGGSMESYYGNNIAEVFFSTTETNAIWVAGNMSTGGNITGEDIEGTVTYNANDRILTIENASISTSENYPSPLIVCNGDLTVNLVGEDNQVYFNGYYGTYVFKNNGATGILTFTGEGTLHINSDYKEGTYFGLCDGFSTVDFGDLAYTINGDSKKISPLDISTPMMNVFEGKIEFITDGYLFGSTTYYKIIYADGSGNGEEVPLTNVVSNQTFDFSNYNEKITISELTGPCTVYAYTKYKEETGASAKAKLFGFTEPLTITYNGTAFELTTADLPAIFPAIEEGDDVTYQIAGVSQGNAVTYDEQTQKYMVQGYGSAVLNIFIGQGDYTPYQVLNEVASLTVNVVAALDFEFVDDNSWASYYATENLTVPTGLTAYVVSDVDEESGAVTVTSIGYIPKNNAVLLEREQNGAASGYTAGAYTGTTTTVNNLLSGSPNTTDISSLGSGPVYVLFNDKFKRAINGTIPARRAYLALNAAVAPVSAPQYLTISIVDGNSTAIDTLTVDDNSNDSWYSIDGLKLKGKPQRKGLYINNGKKVYINNNK